ncbi:hypothetical protein JIQ42_07527 [Leishmania sp. Namibia]|uniref:hypothetical protein n=1 Tax=Leishmania sp. Namibia TaxID=2802991 RepID=UPI001B4EE996|nr:hypothetical protein JIQ42_07527 [Leishmania sp. Namibia]
MPLERQRHQQQSLLPNVVDWRPVHGLLAVPPIEREVGPAVSGTTEWSAWDEAIRHALKLIIEYAVPLAAKETIRGMEYDLGGSLQPVNVSWPQAYKWALVLVIVFSVICLGVVALVLRCIVLERSHAAQMAKGKSRGGLGEDNASSHRGLASRVAPQRETYAEEEGDYYYSYSRDEDWEDRSSSISFWDSDHHGSA